jgi:hypothetical protein
MTASSFAAVFALPPFALISRCDICGGRNTPVAAMNPPLGSGAVGMTSLSIPRCDRSDKARNAATRAVREATCLPLSCAWPIRLPELFLGNKTNGDEA